MYVKLLDVELRVDDCGCPVKFNEELSDFHVINNMKLSDFRFSTLCAQNSITSQLLEQSSSPSVAR